MEEMIQKELVTFIENESNREEFLLVGHEALKISEIIYFKVEKFRYIGF